MSKIIAAINHKGGVGKTTFCSAVGSALAETGLRVLLVDLDSQCSLTHHYVVPAGHPTIYSAMVERQALPISHRDDTVLPTPDIVPGDERMSQGEMAMVARRDRERILDRLLRAVRDDYDVIMIDCPPSLGLLAQQALYAADVAIVPTILEPMAIEGVLSIVRLIEDIAADLGHPAFGGLAIMRYDGRQKMGASLLQSLRAYGEYPILDQIVRQSIDVPRSDSHYQTIHDYAPTSPAALDFRALAAEIKYKFVNK